MPCLLVFTKTSPASSRWRRPLGSLEAMQRVDTLTGDAGMRTMMAELSPRAARATARPVERPVAIDGAEFARERENHFSLSSVFVPTRNESRLTVNGYNASRSVDLCVLWAH